MPWQKLLEQLGDAEQKLPISDGGEIAKKELDWARRISPNRVRSDEEKALSNRAPDAAGKTPAKGQ